MWQGLWKNLRHYDKSGDLALLLMSGLEAAKIFLKGGDPV